MTRHQRIAQRAVAARLSVAPCVVSLATVKRWADRAAKDAGKRGSTPLYPTIDEYAALLPRGWSVKLLVYAELPGARLYAVPDGANVAAHVPTTTNGEPK